MLIKRKVISAFVTIALLILTASQLLAAAAGAPNPVSMDASADPGATLEAMAQQKFGAALTAAERKLLHAAPLRDVPWFGPNDDPDNAANDTAHGEKWGAERTVRAEVVSWLLADQSASQYVHPSGLALAGARIAGSLDLSYATVGKPLTLIRCYVPDGINLLSAHTQDITVRRSRTGPVLGNLANIHGDASFLMGDFGPISFMRARIDGTLDFSGARILNVTDDAVNLVEANIDGDVLFQEGFTTDGIVYARLAKIGHDLSFHGAEFKRDGNSTPSAPPLPAPSTGLTSSIRRRRCSTSRMRTPALSGTTRRAGRRPATW
ncbi:MAG TPA: pentapeptide repeat-containing protein [Candidatus Acidoferrum sp.]|nr:pentapeptide repeat-containing protein [Candidatus Acidoferrum sp.]